MGLYNVILANNPIGTSIYIDDLRLPKGFGFGRKQKFMNLLCNIGLARNDGNFNYTILRPKFNYSTKTQETPETLQASLPKSEEHRQIEQESIRRMRQYLEQEGAIPPDEKK